MERIREIWDNTSGKLRIAVIGAGWVTTHRHIPSLRAPPDVEMVGIVDRYEGRAQEVSRKLQAPRWTGIPLADVTHRC